MDLLDQFKSASGRMEFVDKIAKGVINLVACAFVTGVTDKMYDKVVIERRTNTVVTTDE